MASVACTARSSRFENMMSGAVMARPSANCPTIWGVPIFASTTSMAHWAATYAAFPTRLQERLCLSFGSLALACITGQDCNAHCAGFQRLNILWATLSSGDQPEPGADLTTPLRWLASSQTHAARRYENLRSAWRTSPQNAGPGPRDW